MKRFLLLVYHVVNAASIVAWLISLGLGAVVVTALGWLASFESNWQWPLWIGVFLLTTGITLAVVSRYLPPPSQPIATSLLHPDWTDPEELRRYLHSIKGVMEGEGFGSELPTPETPDPETSRFTIKHAHEPPTLTEERDALLKRGHDLLATMPTTFLTAVEAVSSRGVMGYPAAMAFVRDGQEFLSRVFPRRANPALVNRYRTIEEARFAIEETLKALGNIGHKVTPEDE